MRVSRSTVGLRGFANPEMEFQFMRSLGAAAYGGGSVGELMALREDIADGDPASWTKAFARAAARLSGNDASGAALLRATMYWRAAEYYADPLGDERIRLGNAGEQAFRDGMRRLGVPCERVQVVCDGARLAGYYLAPPRELDVERPLLVVLSGFDGTTEELYFEIGAAARQRGYPVLLIEGPGQIGALRRNPSIPFRPDYAGVVDAFLAAAREKFALGTRPAVLYGVSFGGYFAPRAVADGAQCTGLIANSPIVDLRSYMEAFIGPEFCADPPDIALGEIDTLPDTVLPPLLKHGLKASCVRFGVDSFAGYLARLSDFRLDDPQPVTVPSLVLYGAEEGDETERQALAFADATDGAATVRKFLAEEGAAGHCQFGNLPLSTEVILDWLDTTFPLPAP